MPGFVAAGSTRWRLELAAKPAVEVDGDGASDDMLDSTILVVKGGDVNTYCRVCGAILKIVEVIQ